MLGLIFAVRMRRNIDYQHLTERGLALPALSVTVSMQIVVTLAVLVAGLYVILDPSYAADDKKWGYGIVGTVVGYWLKGAAQ